MKLRGDIHKIFLIICFFSCTTIFAGSEFSQSVPVSIQNKVASLLEHDDFREADSLCTAFDLARFMGPNDLMKWMRIKSTIGQYGQAARFACTALGKGPQYGPMLQYQLAELVKDAKIDTVRAALNAYCLCALGGGGCDTPAFKQWISEIYPRFGLYDDEIDVLVSLDSKKFPSAQGLLESARQRFSQRLFSRVIRPAQQAFARGSTASQKAMCALLLYQSFAQMGKNDSAALWLSRLPLKEDPFKAEAASFFQRSRYFVKADSLIKTLPPSFMRDTLDIRQMLYNGNLQAATEAAGRIFKAREGDRNIRNEAILWRIRTLMFEGAIGAALPLLDSIAFTPSMSWAEEVLSYKYAVFMVQGFPMAWKDFGALRHASWSQQPEIAVRVLARPELENYPMAIKQLFIVDGAKTLEAGKLFSEARKSLERIALSAATAEHRFYYAESLLNTGAPEKAQQVLEELVLKFPGDVFSEKARIVLLRLQNKI